jgi:hypothetical protein
VGLVYGALEAAGAAIGRTIAADWDNDEEPAEEGPEDDPAHDDDEPP